MVSKRLRVEFIKQTTSYLVVGEREDLEDMRKQVWKQKYNMKLIEDKETHEIYIRKNASQATICSFMWNIYF